MPGVQEDFVDILRFDSEAHQWFRDESGAPLGAAVWKMDMIVLLLLYPIVFLWGVVVGTPLLADRLHLPFAVALFVGNVFGASA